MSSQFRIGDPLTSEQVFQIADPLLTLKTIAEIGIPSFKVDLKGRLAVELNRQVLSSNGEAKRRYRKQLKRLLNDKSSEIENKRDLSELLEKNRKKLPELKSKLVKRENNLDRAEKDYKDAEKAKDRYFKKKNKEVELYDEFKSSQEYIDKLTKRINGNHIENTPEMDDLENKIDEEDDLENKKVLEEELNHLGDIELDKMNDELNHYNKKFAAVKTYHPQNKAYKAKKSELEKEYEDSKYNLVEKKEIFEKIKRKIDHTDSIKDKYLPESKQKLSDLDQSILETEQRQDEIEEMEKIKLTENINPAAYEKSLDERIAESNSLFQNILNNGSEPHITLLFESIGKYNDVNELFVEEDTGKISNMVLIIYRSSESFGHWVALTRSNDLRRLTYFNSGGSYIDKSIDFIPEEFADQSRQNFPYLLKLLHRSRYEIHWNDVELQSPGSNTCGYWAGLWMRNNKLGKTLEEFTTPFLSLPLAERDIVVMKLVAPYLN